MVRLLTLGGLAVSQEGEHRAPFPLPHVKRNALLTYLIVEPSAGSHPRDILYRLFWPESDDLHARDALKQLLRSLRRDFGDHLIKPGRNGVELDWSRGRCDANEMVDAAAAGDPVRALELYQGDFLAGFHLSGSAEFEEWAANQRKRLRELAVTSGRLLAEQQEHDGDFRAAIKTVKRVLELEPFDEASVRTLMRLHITMGERGRAVATYEDYAQLLREEFDTTPAPETVALLETARKRVAVAGAPGTLFLDPPSLESDTGTTMAAPTHRVRAWIAAALASALALPIALVLRPTPAPPELRSDRILVDLFINGTGDPGLDHISRLATDHVTAGLTFTTFADVVTRGSSLLSRRGEPIADFARLRDLALERGTGTVVTGTYSLKGDSLQLDAMLSETGSDAILTAIPTVVVALDGITEGLDELRDRVMAAAGAAIDPRLATWSRHASRPPTLEVYKIFVEGLEAHTTHRQFSSAKSLFMEAYGADPSFTMAALWAAQAAINTGDHLFADSLLTVLEAGSRNLAALDLRVLEAFTARSDDARITAWRGVLEAAPGSDYLKNAAYTALRQRRPAEALGYLRDADPESGWLWGWTPFWSDYASALDEVGECDAIPELAKRARRSLPLDRRLNDRAADQLAIRGFACLGESTKLLGAARRYVANREWLGWTGLDSALPRAAQELIAHGHSVGDSNVFLDFVKEDLTGRLNDDPRIAAQLGELLAAFGQRDSARVVLERSYESDNADTWWETPLLLAILDLANGRRDRVEELVAVARRLGQGAPWVDLEIAAVRAHQGDLTRAMLEVKAAHPAGPSSWFRLHQRPLLFGPLLDHEPFQELIGPIG